MLVADFKSVGGVTRSGSIPPSRCFSFDPKVVRFCAKTQHLCTLLGVICPKKAEKRCFEQFEALSCFSCLNALFAFATCALEVAQDCTCELLLQMWNSEPTSVGTLWKATTQYEVSGGFYGGGEFFWGRGMPNPPPGEGCTPLYGTRVSYRRDDINWCWLQTSNL